MDVGTCLDSLGRMREDGYIQLGERQGKIEVELIRKGGKIREAKDSKRERGEENNEKRIIIS